MQVLARLNRPGEWVNTVVIMGVQGASAILGMHFLLCISCFVFIFASVLFTIDDRNHKTLMLTILFFSLCEMVLNMLGYRIVCQCTLCML